MSWWSAFWAQWAKAATRPPEPAVAIDDPDELGEFDGPLGAIPESRREVLSVYGSPGKGKLDRKWARANMHTAKGLPGSWNSGKGRLYCHNLAEPYIREALRRCQVTGVLDEIERLGCFNFRHQRHDSSRPLSYHSFGIALDINSAQNRVRRYKRGQAPTPFEEEWRLVYPNGVSEALVDAFISVGFTWGGHWETFVDPMHFELVA